MSQPNGVLSGQNRCGDEVAHLASMSDWFKTLDITIGAADVVLATVYPTLVCKAIRNETATDPALVVYTDYHASTTTQNLTIARGVCTEKQPGIHTVKGTGSGGTAGVFKFYFQQR